MILYIGNKLANKGFTPTSIETLGTFLRDESFVVKYSSGKKNKVLRLLDMLFSILKYRNKISFVLIDTYSTSNFYFAFFTSQLCRLLKLRYVPILRGGNLEARLKNDPKKSALIFNHAHTNIAPSLFLETIFENYGYTNLTYIPNTIALENYTFKKRNKILPTLLWVRSFAEIYNPGMAIKVVESLKAKGIEAELCMVGPEKDGSLAKTKALAKQLNISVKFTGKLSKKDWIALSESYDIFINTTNFDNTPVSVIEAMALGMPVVSTNVGGIPYLLEDQKDGLLVAKNDVSEMVYAIESLVNSPELVQKIAQNAKNKADQFDWEVVKAQWKMLLDS
jgi:glycosyltransferase involved in cell wall biosynthesis